MQLKVLLVDDEKNSRDILRNYLTKYCANITILDEAENINDAIDLLKKHTIDLVFLDVEMPYGNAFDFIEKLPKRDFEIIFVTAYDHYAVEALNNHAAYYLTKPISIDNLIKAVDYVTEIKKKEHELQHKILVPKTLKVEGKITIPTQNGFEVLAVQDIIYAKADDNYTHLFLENDSKKLVSKTLKYFEDALVNSGFSRIHKSYLVNINAIVSYHKGKGGSVMLNNGKELSVSASKKASLLAHFK
ncbi:MAG: LytTR family DNA-binding domain-containing protein [Flavobacteriaceae bacterium]